MIDRICPLLLLIYTLSIALPIAFHFCNGNIEVKEGQSCSALLLLLLLFSFLVYF